MYLIHYLESREKTAVSFISNKRNINSVRVHSAHVHESYRYAHTQYRVHVFLLTIRSQARNRFGISAIDCRRGSCLPALGTPRCNISVMYEGIRSEGFKGGPQFDPYCAKRHETIAATHGCLQCFSEE